MSLRLRLIAAIAAILLAALVGGGVLMCWRATTSVQVEMRAALAGAEDIARQALARQATRPDPAFPSTLVTGFNGQRHVRATALYLPHTLVAQSRLAKSGPPPPAWFRALVDVRPQSVQLTLSPRGSSGREGREILRLQTDTANEMAEVWEETHDAFGVLLMFCGGIFIATYVIVGRFTRRFSNFDRALRELADNHYETMLAERGPPEFVALSRGFNLMAGRVREFKRRNSELTQQLLTLQEEERTEIARDLHDEVGPHLFAINVDAEGIAMLAPRHEADEIVERAHAIRDSAAHIQKHVKAILRQLRPASALEFGLRAAVDDLIAFWTRRNPEVGFQVDIDLGPATIDQQIEDVIYRLVQESISNAIRHGRPTAVAISIRSCSPGGLSVSVTDNGGGLHSAPQRHGLGLAGMAERVEALSGRFEVANNIDGPGVTATAFLPPRLNSALAASLTP